MRTTLVVVMGMLVMFLSTFCLALSNYKGDGYLPQRPMVISSTANCGSNSCENAQNAYYSCSSPFSGPPCYTCACADINCSSNPCMSSCRYCAAFGNVGDGDLGPPLR